MRFTLRFFCLLLLSLGITLGWFPSLAQTPNLPILEVQGRLESSDTQLQDGSFYDELRFFGTVGQSVTITLESLEFDVSLLLYDANLTLLDSSSDLEFPVNPNAAITIVLPQTGEYRIRATSSNAQVQGAYRLTVMTSAPGVVANLSPAALRQVEANRLWQQADDQRNQGQWQPALHNFQQALAVYQQTGNRALEAGTLNQIGLAYGDLGQYPQAMEYLQQSIALQQALGNRIGESNARANLGAIYNSLGQYPEALAAYDQALALIRSATDQQEEGFDYEAGLLSRQANVLYSLGQYSEALVLLEQALQRQQTSLNGIMDLGSTANQIGLVYTSLEQYDLALEYFQEALLLQQKTSNRAGEAAVLSNIGLAYSRQAQYEQSLNYYQQALVIHQEVGNRAGEAVALNNIARVQEETQQLQLALESYQQALQIAQEIGDRYGVSVILNNLGALLGQAGQPEIGIALMKQAVNQWETIRSDLRTLETSQQQAFVDSIADTYRLLANLLLQQDRVLEAQQVLDLLKLQELEDYLKNLPETAQTSQGLEFWQAEQRILTLYEQEYPVPFEQFGHHPEVRLQVEQLQRAAREQTLNPNLLTRLQNNLKQSQQLAALLYPLILEDRLELILITPNSPPIRRVVSVSQAQLEQTILQFRGELTTRTGALQTAAAQQLYDWLIRPIAADLTTAQIQTILFAADGRLRYVPLAALYDAQQPVGQEWLIQRFQINYITAASLTDFSRRAPAPQQVLAAAFSDVQQVYQFTVGNQSYAFRGLENAGSEVSDIATELPTTQLLNQFFSRAAIEAQMNAHSIVHLATHAELVSGSPGESFILFGNGERITLKEIADWQMPNVDLVVLSACRTALGGRLGNGEEILGFGYQIQRTGARAALASLWYVDDAGTQTLMDRFYAALAQGMPGIAALRQAQMDLIAGNPTQPTSHPYFWAPFILIGNGL